jgi:dUTP pyrophosphatase
VKLKTKRFNKKIALPRYEKKAAGFDFYCAQNTTIKPGEFKALPTNIAVEIPEGYAILLLPRSSTPIRHGLMMPHSLGLIDPFYCGDKDEVILLFYNFTNKISHIKKGIKIAQGVLIKYEKAEFIEFKSLEKKGRGGYRMKPRNKFKKYQ